MLSNRSLEEEGLEIHTFCCFLCGTQLLKQEPVLILGETPVCLCWNVPTFFVYLYNEAFWCLSNRLRISRTFWCDVTQLSAEDQGPFCQQASDEMSFIATSLWSCLVSSVITGEEGALVVAHGSVVGYAVGIELLQWWQPQHLTNFQ